MKRIGLIWLIVSLFEVAVVQAVDLGQVGNGFNIKEEGFVAMIKRKLTGLNLEAEAKQIQQRVQKKIAEPLAVEGITRCEKGREFIYDPTYIVMEDIKLPGGKVLHKAGVSINPLGNMNIEQELVFIDGSDEGQVNWLKQQNLKEVDKVILVKGKPFELEEKLDRAIYFDQFGELTKKFKIKQVPARVVQEGKVLKINEIALMK